MRRAIVTLTVGVLLTVVGTALAVYSSIAQGSATASSTSVPAASVSVSVSGESVSITWPAVTVGDATATSYTVKRYPAAGGTGTTLACTASPCTDTPGSGQWKYGVVAHFNNWSSDEALSGQAVVTTTTTTPAPAFGLELLVDTVTTFATGNQTARLSNLPANTTVTFTIDTTTLTASEPTGSDYGLTIPCMTNGTKTVTATAKSGSTVVATATDTFAVDGLCAMSLSLRNRAGGTAGRVDNGDWISIQFSSAIAPTSVCPAGWTGTARGVSLSISDASPDALVIDSSSCDSGPNKFAFGSLALGDAGYTVSKQVTFTGSTMSWDGTTNTLLVTFGTPCSPGGSCGSLGTVTSSTATYTPAAAIKSTTNVGASGSVSKTAQHF